MQSEVKKQKEECKLPAKNENKTFRKKLRILEKAIESGLKTEKDFSNLPAKEYHDLQKKCKFRESDSDIFFELCEAIRTNKLITFLSKENSGGENVETSTPNY